VSRADAVNDLAPPARGLTWSLAFERRWRAGQLALLRPADGLRILLDARDVRCLREGSPAPRLRRLVRELVKHGVLTEARPAAPPKIRGKGALGKVAADLLAEGGFGLPALRAEDAVLRGRRAKPDEVLLALWGTRLVALREGPRGCRLCLRLRMLAREGRNGEDQTARVEEAPSLSPEEARPLVAALLQELEAQPLAEGDTLLLTPGQGFHRGELLIHPDCPRCPVSRPKDPREAADVIRERLGSKEPARLDSHAQARAALGDEAIGPIEIEERKGRRGQYPLDGPLIWGSVYATRLLRGRAVCSSTYGGIYASTPDLALSRLVALSEGVERLSARSARPDVWARASERADAIRPSELYGWAGAREDRQRRAFCFGLDVIRNEPCLVPYEAVVVGLPLSLYPEACHKEPFYSGAASHGTLEAALIHATIELLKRDAFMIAWYRRRALPRLRFPKRLSEVAEKRWAYLERRGIELELFDLTFDMPLPMLLLRGTARRARGNWPKGGAMLVPAGGFSADRALEDALRLLESQYVSIALEPSPLKDPRSPRAVRAFARSAPFWPSIARYLDPRSRDAHAFLGRGERDFEALPQPAPASSTNQAADLKDWLLARGQRWILVRLTDAIAERAGFEVAKVVIPGLVGIAPSREAVNLALPRMRAPIADATLSEPNPDPHPLY
jgi:thiazole/oxazole-forming peptide maturase SagD family component